MNYTNTFSLRMAGLALAGLASGLAGSACSLSLSFDECKVDADCIEAGYTCEDGKCVSDDGVADDPTTDTGSETATTTESSTDPTETSTATDTSPRRPAP